MLFPEKITLIRPDDRVLEIGPGALPHARSNVFLELRFDQDEDRISQRGGLSGVTDLGGRPIYHYEGKQFPFADQQFDYVICSHVIEHVIDPLLFMNEIFRVSGGRGYLEYPLSTYEYLYDFDVHLQYIKYDAARSVLQYLPKKETAARQFAPITSVLRRTLECGWDDLCAANKLIFFEGFEFSQPFTVEKARDFQALTPDTSALARKKSARRLVSRVMNKLRW